MENKQKNKIRNNPKGRQKKEHKNIKTAGKQTFWHKTQRDLALNTHSDQIRFKCAQLVQDTRTKNRSNTGNRTKNTK